MQYYLRVEQMGWAQYIKVVDRIDTDMDRRMHRDVKYFKLDEVKPKAPHHHFWFLSADREPNLN